jgi:hypothetical protein
MATFLLGVLATSALGGLLFGLTGAHQSQARAAASAWAQEEMDYLLLRGYSGLSASTRSVTPSGEYTTYGQYKEPQLPPGFDHAVIGIEAVEGVPAKQVTITLYQSPSAAFTVFSTYISNFTYP